MQKDTNHMYYEINETAARRAKEAVSFSDYKPGSATEQYRRYVDEAAELAERQKQFADPLFHEKIDRLLDTYARKLAENINKANEITARVPSIMIAGRANFPVRKKEQQNAALDRNMQEYRDIQGLLDKIRSTGTGGISADDPNAIEKLESKLSMLEQAQENMKAVNAYYRKHKTLEGCPYLTQEQVEKMKACMADNFRMSSRPYESYLLSNNNAEIHRIRGRIATLMRRKEIGYAGWEFAGGRVQANTKENRLQILFDEKPGEATRTELKSKGFHWSPKAGAWQRQLNDNAIYAVEHIHCVQPLTGESPWELQKRVRREIAEDKQTMPEQSEQEETFLAPQM